MTRQDDDKKPVAQNPAPEPSIHSPAAEAGLGAKLDSEAVEAMREVGLNPAAYPILAESPYRFQGHAQTWQGRQGTGWTHALTRDGVAVALVRCNADGGELDVEPHNIPGGGTWREAIGQITWDFEELAKKMPLHEEDGDLPALQPDWGMALAYLSTLADLDLL